MPKNFLLRTVPGQKNLILERLKDIDLTQTLKKSQEIPQHSSIIGELLFIVLNMLGKYDNMQERNYVILVVITPLQNQTNSSKQHRSMG